MLTIGDFNSFLIFCDTLYINSTYNSALAMPIFIHLCSEQLFFFNSKVFFPVNPNIYTCLHKGVVNR